MSVQLFLVVVAVSAIDPLVMLGYGIAGWAGRTWRGAAGAGALAGVVVGALSLGLAATQGAPAQPLRLLAQLCTCVLGATLVRLAIDGVRALRAARPA